MAKAVDKIRSYIERETLKGNLPPGARLPSYSELQSHFGYSYATVQNAMHRLQSEKTVDIINGKGCYVATPKTLKLAFYIQSSTLDFATLQELFARHLDPSLRVEIKLHETQRYGIKPPDNETHAIMVDAVFNSPYAIPGLTSFEFFNGFHKQLSEFNIPDMNIDTAFYFPFYAGCTQFGINLDLLEPSGYSPDDLTGDFSWWNDFLEQYDKKSTGIAPAGMYCDQQYPWWFSYFQPLLANLLINERKSPEAIYHAPLFDTAGGSRLLDIIASLRGNTVNSSFKSNNAIFELGACTWIATQHRTRRDFQVKNFLIKPYQFNGRKICLVGTNCLQTFMHHNLDNDERNRIWEVLKTLTSKPFQLDFCNLTGMLSVRKDVVPDEYTWNDRPDFAAFIPRQTDIIISNNLFPPYTVATLAALIEQYIYYGADKSAILRQLDKKVVFNIQPSANYTLH